MNIDQLAAEVCRALEAPPERLDAVKEALQSKIPLAEYDATFLAEVQKARLRLLEKGFNAEHLAGLPRGRLIEAARSQASVAHVPVWQKRSVPEYWPLPAELYQRGGASHELVQSCALLLLEAERTAFLASQNKPS